MPRKKNRSSAGRSIVPRPDPEASPPPVEAVIPIFPVPVRPRDETSAEVEGRKTDMTFVLKFPGLRLNLKSVWFFRRGASRGGGN